MVLFGGFALPSVYAKTTHITSDFESSGTPLCSTEEVIFSGTQHLDLQEANGRTVAHTHYNVQGIGVQTGTKYTVHVNEKDSLILNANGDTTFSTTIHGSSVSSGSGDNTKVTMKLISVIHPNGDIDTIVDDTSIECPG